MKKDVINIHQFRRLFPVIARPPKKTIIKWIEEGTKEGAKAPAFAVDGNYFFEATVAQEFIRELGFEPESLEEKE